MVNRPADHSVEYFSGLIALAKVMKIEIGGLHAPPAHLRRQVRRPPQALPHGRLRPDGLTSRDRVISQPHYR
jgi:hypothetical protein